MMIVKKSYIAINIIKMKRCAGDGRLELTARPLKVEGLANNMNE